MKGKSIKRILTSVLCILIIVLTFFNFWLNYLAFKTKLEAREGTFAEMIAKPDIDKIEYAIKYGKPIERFFGIEEIIGRTKEENEEIENIMILLPDYTVLYTLNTLEKGIFFIEKPIDFSKENKAHHLYEAENYYNVLIPVHKENKWVATYVIQLDKKIIEVPINAFIKSNLKNLIKVMLIGCFIIILSVRCFYRGVKEKEYKEEIIRKKNIHLTVWVAIIITGIQIIGSIPMIKSYERMTLEHIDKASVLIEQSLCKQINEVIHKGVLYEDILDLSDWMHKYVEKLEQIETVSIGEIKVEEEQLLYTSKLAPDSSGVEPTLSVVVSKTYIEKQIREVVLDGITIIITIIIVLVECILLINETLKLKGMKFANKVQKDVYANFSRIRILAFVFTIICQLPSSFIPIIIKDIYQQKVGMDIGFVASLAVSIYVLGTMLTTLGTGFLMKKLNWTTLFKWGIVIMASGLCLSAFSKNIYLFLGARLIDGCGYGLAWMSLRGALINETDKEERTKKLTQLNAGLFSGINCGVIIGAMLFDRLGYTTVFLISGIGMLGLCVLTHLFIRSTPIALTEGKVQSVEGKKRRFNLEIIIFLILITIPSSMFIMFLKYYFPLYAQSVAFSQSNTGRVFLLYGSIVVYTAPFLNKVMCNKIGLKKSTYIAFVGVALGFILFALKPSIVTAILAVVIMGFMDSFGLTAQNEYFGEMEAVKKMGYAKAMGWYNTIKKLGQTVAPTLFASMFTFGFTNGIGVVGLMSLILFIVYIMYTIIISKKNTVSYEGREEWF